MEVGTSIWNTRKLIGGYKVGPTGQGVWPAIDPLGPHISGLCTRPHRVRCIPGVALILVEFLISCNYLKFSNLAHMFLKSYRQ
jgi:hypothetical protein